VKFEDGGRVHQKLESAEKFMIQTPSLKRKVEEGLKTLAIRTCQQLVRMRRRGGLQIEKGNSLTAGEPKEKATRLLMSQLPGRDKSIVS
jgi:hypothetical protein